MGTRRTQTLMAEIELYLATVELFRIEGCEPCWHGEADRVLRAGDSKPDAQSRGRRGSSKSRKGR